MEKEPQESITEELNDESVKKMYETCKKKLFKILKLRLQLKKLKKNERNVIKALNSSKAVQEFLQSQLSSPFYLLLQNQLKNVSRKLVGRKWTLQDKILALSMYKKSSLCYHLLRRLFYLPTGRSLKVLLKKIPSMCGILMSNTKVNKKIKEITKQSYQGNLCVLALNKIRVQGNMGRNMRPDHGCQDTASQRETSRIPKETLKFMVIGIKEKWKQSVAFYFSETDITAHRLSTLIKEVLDNCFDADLEVLSIVCNCDGVNLSALNLLGSTIDQPYFEYKGHEIVTILDPPHLLKSFRNHFMRHDIEFKQEVNGEKCIGVAKWAHIVQFYNVDSNGPILVYAPALSPQHLKPQPNEKCKLYLAAQVFAHPVAVGLHAKVATKELPEDAVATAALVSNMDKLFDAFSGDNPKSKYENPLLMNMSKTSRHLQLFSKMKNFFEEMTFLGSKNKPLCQEGWLMSINAIERLFKNLRKYYHIKTLSPLRLRISHSEKSQK